MFEKFRPQAVELSVFNSLRISLGIYFGIFCTMEGNIVQKCILCFIAIVLFLFLCHSYFCMLYVELLNNVVQHCFEELKNNVYNRF